MKTIINKVTHIKKSLLPDEKEFITYFDLMKSVIDRQPEQGFTTEEMRKRLRVLNAIGEKLPLESADLEDADFATLQTAWQAMRWGMVHKDIIAVEDYLSSLSALTPPTAVHPIKR